MARKLPPSFYRQSDVLRISRALLGCLLVARESAGVTTAGVIIETEAYRGIKDRASHAYGNRLTPRTATMFENGGIAYVYLCYGMHRLFNVVTHRQGIPDAVLIRALYPMRGLKIMRQRRKAGTSHAIALTNGPGKLTQAMGIDLRHNGISLGGNTIWIERCLPIKESVIHSGPRIGVEYAGPDATRPWRFWLPAAVVTRLCAAPEFVLEKNE